ncbi:hypothetical protein ACT29H_06520 [Thermophagus sp. OGC60D27]|uniref:hypothetical protein n=1 Tax=Thermophagus sp. OGC60D27 TaxID=3458415 RepID=UPI0040383C21
MRGAMPDEESIIVLMAKTAMEKRAYFRQLPGIDRDKTLFPRKQMEHPELINKGSD